MFLKRPQALAGNEQRAKSVAHELKLSCSMCEPCINPPMIALRSLLMVLNEQNICFIKLALVHAWQTLLVARQ